MKLRLMATLIGGLALFVAGFIIAAEVRSVVASPAAAAESGVPIGTVVPYAGSTVPTGWLMADGSAISRTTYSALFTAIGTTYGAGDGSTTFNLPSLKGRVSVGHDTAQTEFDVLGETGGEKTHQLTVAELPAHTHSFYTLAQLTVGGGPGYYGLWGDGGSTTGSTGSDAPHNNLEPYIVLNYIICTSGGAVVGGIGQLPNVAGTGDSLPRSQIIIAAVTALVAFAAGGWYAKRRWLG